MNECNSKVYILVDSNNNIVRLEGGYTTPDDLSGWIEIDEGTGDKYNLCQTNYLEKPLVDQYTEKYNYKYIDGEIVEK